MNLKNTFELVKKRFFIPNCFFHLAKLNLFKSILPKLKTLLFSMLPINNSNRVILSKRNFKCELVDTMVLNLKVKCANRENY